MRYNRKQVLLILLIPFVAMLLLSFWKSYRFNVGNTIELKVEGFDPRDLLRGHYVTYQVRYGVDNLCYNKNASFRAAGFICFDTKQFSYQRFRSCTNMLKGICQRGRFSAGIEKFYIPQEHATALDKHLREKRGSIQISLTADGKAMVKELLIDGRAWQEVVK